MLTPNSNRSEHQSKTRFQQILSKPSWKGARLKSNSSEGREAWNLHVLKDYSSVDPEQNFPTLNMTLMRDKGTKRLVKNIRKLWCIFPRLIKYQKDKCSCWFSYTFFRNTHLPILFKWTLNCPFHICKSIHSTWVQSIKQKIQIEINRNYSPIAISIQI